MENTIGENNQCKEQRRSSLFRKINSDCPCNLINKSVRFDPQVALWCYPSQMNSAQSLDIQRDSTSSNRTLYEENTLITFSIKQRVSKVSNPIKKALTSVLSKLTGVVKVSKK
jgi:hypothetical protein